MSTPKSALDGLDITHDELDRLTKALKNDEFKQLFADYYNEINDPANQRLYEQELTQFEKERGVDVTFLHPRPGYVLKTCADGRHKTFINVAQSDKVDKPTSKCGVNGSGEKGLVWGLPYAQSAAKRDYDKSGEACAVYDVVFHPDTIHLAEKNDSFKQMVASTAMEAVAKANNIVLDVVNVKYPRIAYKGAVKPTIIRKKSKTFKPQHTEPSPLDAIYRPLETDDKPVQPQAKIVEDPKTPLYATPKHTITQRRHVDYAELTNELDAKLNVTLPSELVITVELPFLRNIKDTTLDVTGTELYLVSEVPAKYQLKLRLPYAVDETRGSAKFDAVKRSLVVQLPVKRRLLTIDDITNGNAGEEQEPVQQVAMDSSKAPLIEELSSKSSEPVAAAVASPTAKSFTSKQSVAYELPAFTTELSDNIIAFTLDVKNVVQSSVEVEHGLHFAHVKFTSIGSGCFPQYFAFYVRLDRQTCGQIAACQPEVWDNNLILQLELDGVIRQRLGYEAGLTADDLKSYAMDVPAKKGVPFDASISLAKLSLEEKNQSEPLAQTPRTPTKATKDKIRSYSESNCDDFDTHRSENVPQPKGRDHACVPPRTPIKQRAYSECSGNSVDESGQPRHLKGILKRRGSSVWSISESSLDENGGSMMARSVDFTESGGEEHLSEHAKKSVRFDNNIRKFCFRTNSTIVGQRKPKTNKRKKKKSTGDRRYSEGEASDYDPKHSSSESESTANGHKIAKHSNNNNNNGMKSALNDSGVDLSERRDASNAVKADDEDEDDEDDEVYHEAHEAHHNNGGVELKFKSDMIFDLDM